MKKFASYLIYAILIACIACACNDHIDVQQSYEFKVVYLPVQKKLKKGEVAEIRCQLVKEGNYSQAEYFLRYFQPDGKGQLKLDDGTVFLPNDSYKMDRETFRLYYTSMSEERQTIDIVFFDSFGRQYPLSFDFNNDSSKED